MRSSVPRAGPAYPLVPAWCHPSSLTPIQHPPAPEPPVVPTPHQVPNRCGSNPPRFLFLRSHLHSAQPPFGFVPAIPRPPWLVLTHGRPWTRPPVPLGALTDKTAWLRHRKLCAALPPCNKRSSRRQIQPTEKHPQLRSILSAPQVCGQRTGAHGKAASE